MARYIRDFQANQIPLGVPDAIIAATAVTYRLTLVTLNIKDFLPVHGVSLFPLPPDMER